MAVCLSGPPAHAASQVPPQRTPLGSLSSRLNLVLTGTALTPGGRSRSG